MRGCNMYESFEKFIKIRDTRIRITSIVKYGISVYVDNEYRFKKEHVEQCNKTNKEHVEQCNQMNKEYVEQCNQMLGSENEQEAARSAGWPSLSQWLNGDVYGEKEEDRASCFVERPKIKPKIKPMLTPMPTPTPTPIPTCDPRDGMRILEVTVVGESGGFVTNYFFDCDIDIDSEIKKLDDYFGL
jgi:hypothetical protein